MTSPIFMLNALWFKPNGGKEKYAEYGAAVAPLLEKHGALWLSTKSQHLHGYGRKTFDMLGKSLLHYL